MLTRKQYELLTFIDKTLRDTGISPSYDEMKAALDLKYIFEKRQCVLDAGDVRDKVSKSNHVRAPSNCKKIVATNHAARFQKISLTPIRT